MFWLSVSHMAIQPRIVLHKQKNIAGGGGVAGHMAKLKKQGD